MHRGRTSIGRYLRFTILLKLHCDGAQSGAAPSVGESGERTMTNPNSVLSGWIAADQETLRRGGDSRRDLAGSIPLGASPDVGRSTRFLERQASEAIRRES